MNYHLRRFNTSLKNVTLLMFLEYVTSIYFGYVISRSRVYRLGRFNYKFTILQV